MLDPDFLAAIGHPARLRALVLLEQEPADTREVAARCALPAEEAEEHLRLLADARLIEPAPGDGDRPVWRTRATGWAGLSELLAGTAAPPPADGA
jgi:DNA-binding transcriptional ArsR family regulator